MTETTQVANVLDQQLANMINKAMQGAEQAGEFLVSEIPEVVTQLLMWHAVSGLVWAIIGLLGITIALFIVRPNLWKEDGKMYDTRKSEPTGTCVWRCILCIIIGFFGFGNFFANFMTPIQIWVAPKVWLIEYAASLAK